MYDQIVGHIVLIVGMLITPCRQHPVGKCLQAVWVCGYVSLCECTSVTDV